ncbi:hypothetical protein [Bacillus sp. S14(2024)]
MDSEYHTARSEVLISAKAGQIFAAMNGRKIEGENHEKAATYSKSISS